MDKKIIFVVLLLAVIGVGLLLNYISRGLKRAYDSEVYNELSNSESVNGILTEEDIKPLPEPVQKYLRYAGTIGKEKVRNFRVTFEGEFKTNPKGEWGKMSGEQYNVLDDTKRFYYLQMKMFGLPVSGFHKYTDAKATMLVKIAGLLTVADGRGPEMNEGETVTVFNDMCALAPASLIDKRIQWETIDPLTVKATFDNKGVKVSATLYFNEKGEMINFVSDDRYYSPTGKTYQKIRWSTPGYKYQDYRGVKLSSGGEAVWSFPEGDYCYGKITIKDVRYNVSNRN